jgi:transcriptional regulator with XRE-family HTH domain
MREPDRVSELWRRIEEIAQEKRGLRGYVVLQLNGVSPNTIRLMRLGYVPKQASTRQRIADALGVSVDELFGSE